MVDLFSCGSCPHFYSGICDLMLRITSLVLRNGYTQVILSSVATFPENVMTVELAL